MNLRLAALAFITLVMSLASSARAFPGNVTSVPSELMENMRVRAGGPEQDAKMGFWKAGPIGMLSAKTHLSGKGRLEFYAGSKGFVVNQVGAIYDLEGGAVFKVRKGLALTGSYRMLGYDFLATGSENTEPQLSGAFLGMQLEF